MMNITKSFSLCRKMALKIGKSEDGKQSLQEALALDPGFVEALHTLLAVYHKEEDYEQIIDLIQEVRGYGKKIEIQLVSCERIYRIRAIRGSKTIL